MNAPQAAILLQPALQPPDPVARHWLAMVTLRLRREIAWCWFQRSPEQALPTPTAGSQPPFTDPAQDSLNQLRFADDKAEFMSRDATAAYLGELIAALRPAQGASRWAGMAQALELDDAAQFVLACALAARSDASLGAVAAAALNDAHRPHINLALAQRLWPDPLAIVACAEPTHALYRSGLLRRAGSSHDAHEDWMAPLDMPAAVAGALLADPMRRVLPAALRPLPQTQVLPPQAEPLALWLRTTPVQAMQIVPVQTRRGADTAAWVAALGEATGGCILQLSEDIGPQHAALPALASAAWLQGADLLAPDHWAEALGALQGHAADWWAPVAALAMRWYLPVDSPGALRGAQPALLTPAFQVPTLDTRQRGERWAAAAVAGAETSSDDAQPAQHEQLRRDAAEAARRYRLPALASQRLEALLRSGEVRDREALFALAQGEAAMDMAQLAQPVALRFELKELVLPPPAHSQLRAIVTAMRQLGRVHHDWGCARAWNESGLAVMFCGPPGTGKTMAAEALAHELALPMYRIDLSQVVNKYIGETEKNLRRIFDAAEASDCLLFFDEADALFGKRTEVRDAHDRFANIEISYLLERMERFKGLAVLATNRRKDLDEAFTRRLRFIVEFPVPGPAERMRLWRQVFPAPVSVDGVDFGFLAQRFELAGGAIRSAAFNACLQAAARDGEAHVAMADVLLAIKRELEKGGREVADEQFGHYAALLAAPPPETSA